MEDPIVQKIRDGFDELFLWSETTLKPATKELFQILGIEGFAEIYLNSKKYGFAASQKILQDLVKLSFAVYTNLDKLPLRRKVILPEKNWSYKFIVASLPWLIPSATASEFEEEGTNTLFLLSTWDGAHAAIAKKMWLSWTSWDITVLWWAWIDIDHDNKTLDIHDDSGAYQSCSNQFVERMLEEYQAKGYTITIDMKAQKEFFKDFKEVDMSADTAGVVKQLEEMMQEKYEKVSEEELMERKLRLLHSLLTIDLSVELPEKLSGYADAFGRFRQATQGCKDPFEEKYIIALSEFRDELLEK